MDKMFTKMATVLTAALVALTGMQKGWAQNPNTFLTQTATQVISDAFGCAAWAVPYTDDNQYYRIYDLATYNTNNLDSFQVRNVEIGLYMTSSVLAPTGTHPIYVKIHKLNTPTFTSLANLTLLAQKDTSIGMGLNNVTLPISLVTRIGANERIVVETGAASGTPNLTAIGFGFIYGPETGPSYITSTGCGLPAPATVSSLVTTPQLAVKLNVNGEFFSLPDTTGFTVFRDTICAGAVGVNYAVATADHATTYEWTYSGGGVSINGNGSAAVTINASLGATSGFLTCTPKNYYGSAAAVSRYIQIDSVFHINLNLVNPVICLGDSVTLEGPAGYSSYRWEPPTGLTVLDDRITRASPANSHSYTLVVEDQFGCRGVGATFVSINTGPVIQLQPDPVHVCDKPVTVTLSGAVEYEWTPATGVTDPFAAVTDVRPGSTTNYTIIAKDAMGCTSETPVTVTVNNLGSITITQQGRILSVPEGYGYLWYKDGQPVVPHAIFRQYNVKGPGTYKVLVTDANGCQAFSDEVVIKSLGIGSLDADMVKIYPNPSKDKIFIETDLKIGYELLSVDGKSVLKASGTKTVDMSGLADGMYYLLVYDLDTQAGTTFKVQKIEE